MRMFHWLLVLGGFALAGCGGGRDRTNRTDTVSMGRTDSAGMNMQGMNMQGIQMMPEMRAHMDSMARMSPQQMQATMANHQALMSQMMDRMGADMRGMKMSGSAEWNALTDSVKQDLAELPGLKGSALASRMRAHGQRVRRLIAMHESMTKP